MKAQAAVEYLTTYGWAIMIIAVVAAILFSILTLNAGASQLCILPQGLSCSGSFSQNGMLQISLSQALRYPIEVTSIGCISPQSLSHMQNVGTPPSNYVYMQVDSNYTFFIQCYLNNTAFSGTIGAPFSGSLVLNYTNAQTNFPNTVYGQISGKVSR